MNTIKKYIPYLMFTFVLVACADNKLDVEPNDENFPFRLILDTDEGGDLADAEDYGLEVAFADFIGDLPEETVTVNYVISNLTDDMVGVVKIDRIFYEEDDTEIDLNFTQSIDGLTGTITLNTPGGTTLPEEFEIVFALPGLVDTEGSFKFSLSNLQAGEANIVLGTPYEFEYEVLNHELAGSWVMELTNETEFNDFKEVFGSLNPDFDAMEFSDVKVGEVVAVEFEFEYEEANVTLTYIDVNDEEIEIEIEGEYDFEAGEIEFEGSHIILGDDGEEEGELDFIIEAGYVLGLDQIEFNFLKVIDEDNYEEGEELFFSDTGSAFMLSKD